MSERIDILKKIEKVALVGRGGAAYPTALKWRAVKNALKKENDAYIIINGSEGEPGVKKDAYILKNHGAEVVNGINFAFKFIGEKKVKKIYFFLKSDYYQNYLESVKKTLSLKKYLPLSKKIEFFIKPEDAGYIGGEESVILNVIEDGELTPRLRPPYPTEKGLFNKPTLIHNIETLYNISLVSKNEYLAHRFYTISGAVKHHGVFDLPANLSIEEILLKTKNYPDFKFFVQNGGEASGEVLNSGQLNAPAEGSGSIIVYNEDKTDQKKLLRFWLNFFAEESCGNCTACREGTYRLRELIDSPKFNQELFNDLIENLELSSLCVLGSSLAIPVKSYFKNIKI